MAVAKKRPVADAYLNVEIAQPNDRWLQVSSMPVSEAEAERLDALEIPALDAQASLIRAVLAAMESGDASHGKTFKARLRLSIPGNKSTRNVVLSFED